MTSLIAGTGLTVDVGLWLVAKGRLQRAVDMAALSVILDRPTPAQAGTGVGFAATARSRAVLANQGIVVADLTTISTTVPRTNQLTVQASQWVPTAFAKVIGVTGTTISANATADINTYVEIPVSPICGGQSGLSGSSTVCDGGVGDITMTQSGVSRTSLNGDPYTNPSSVHYNGADGQPALPEGYLYRVDVAAGYTGALAIQAFDPDNFNRSDPDQYYSPCPATGSCTRPIWTEVGSLLTTHGTTTPAIVPNKYSAGGYHLFWRVDECISGGDCQREADQTPLEFTLWYLDPDALDPLNPVGSERKDIERVLYKDSRSSYTCQSAGTGRPQRLDTGTPCTTRTWTCSATDGSGSSCTDLRWVTLFSIADVDALCGGSACYPKRVDGSRSFFIYVRSLGTTQTENGYHLRSGPPFGDSDQNTDAACTTTDTYTDGTARRAHVNGQSACPWNNGRPGANTKIYARRAMPTNAMQYSATGGVPYIVWLGYIPKQAAGQTLLLRNFDLDRTGSCPPTSSTNSVTYWAWFPSDNSRVSLTTGCGSVTDSWLEHTLALNSRSDTSFWGTDEGFWLYADVFQKTNVYDTATWEVIFNRARLVR